MSTKPQPVRAWHDEFVPHWIGTELRYIHSDQAVVRFNRLHPTSDGLTAYVEVVWLPSETLLHAGRWDLMGARTMSGLSKAVKERAQNKGIPDPGWEDTIFEVVTDAIQVHKEGDPVVRLADVAATRQKFLIRPLVGSVAATSIIGPGGSFKSAVALAAALTVTSGRSGYLGMKPERSGPVLYLDWEADAATHAERSEAMALDPADRDGLLYQYQKGRPLARVVEQIKRQIDLEGVVMCVVDSVMLARGGDAFGPEPTIAFYAALATLEVPCLLVDHKSREAIEKGKKGPYGSIVNDNTLRLAWEIGGAHELPDGSSQILLVPGKRNNFGRLPRLAFEVRIETDDDEVWQLARFRPANPKVVKMPERVDETPLRDRIIRLILDKGGAPMRVAVIAEALAAKPDAIRLALNRDSDLFVNVSTTGSGMWTLRHDRDKYRANLPVPM